MAREWVRALAVIAGVFLLSQPVLAQTPSSADELTAAAQFDRGLSEMQAGRYEIGCPALAESYRLDPKAGALFTLAECEAKWGRIASASVHYDDYLRLLDRMTPAQKKAQQRRETVAKTQRDELRPQIPTLQIRLAAATPASTVVKRDGVIVGEASLGVALPIDPGEHVLVAEAADGSRQREQRVTIAIAEKKEVTLELAPEAAPVETPPPAVVPPVTPIVEQRPAVVVSERWRGWPYVAFGTAAVAAAVGGITGALVLGRKSTIDEHCQGVACDADGKSAADAAQTLGTVSTVSFIVAGVGLAIGLVLVLTDPARKPSAAALNGIAPPTSVRLVW